MNPGKNDLDRLEYRLDKLSETKASKDFVNSELDNLKNRVESVEDEMDETTKIALQHKCKQETLLNTMEARNMDNARSVKRLYIWQASVGISLLVFFLTFGIAALRYVDHLDYQVKATTSELDRVTKTVNSKDSNAKELEDIIKKALKEAKTE